MDIVHEIKELMKLENVPESDLLKYALYIFRTPCDGNRCTVCGTNTSAPWRRRTHMNKEKHKIAAVREYRKTVGLEHDHMFF